ncbi:Site-specific DNA recombinase [Dehalogenimonas formicexedens]|uniref:Site-specific DNA recombinase n=1 Tax=Dehalogenimonas formicexedens TaxID=1839801 RepID=A0A1P8F9E7_9CHLR|nr:recombinase family protein [Dehalogenimonas formicexedens]APV45087.1 Site-specific DNA recombinase [Dehalogenimonas formicexedens]
MKAALYCRVSSEAQDTVLSLSAQLRALREFAGKNGYEVAREFIDEAESGRSTDRPAFKEMISVSRLKPPPFDTILVWKLNRFARNRGDSVTYKMLLKKQGISVVSISEPVDDSPTGHLLEGIIESVDEFYSLNMGQDIRRGQAENARRGFYNGSKPPYGYQIVKVKDGEKLRNKIEPLPEDSVPVRVVKLQFEMSLSDKGCKAIATKLNTQGFRTLKGERWGRTTVYKVLANEAYAGVSGWGSVRLENAWPAIISRDEFNLVKQKLGNKSPLAAHPRTVTSQYLLSSLLFCACGHSMSGHSAKSSSYAYYQCQRNFKQGKEACCSRSLPKDKLERIISENLKSTILTDDNLEKLVMYTNEDIRSSHRIIHDRLECVDAELREAGARLLKLYEAIETGIVTLHDLAPRIRELRNKQEELSKVRVQLDADAVVEKQEQVNLQKVKSYAGDLRVLLDEGDVLSRKAFIKTFVKGITIEGNEAKVEYRLPLPGGETETVLPIDTFGGLTFQLDAKSSLFK